MDSPSSEPASLVEAGLGPSRGDRARPELEHRTLRRCAARRQLEQDTLPERDPVEATDVEPGHAPRTEIVRQRPVTTTCAAAGRPICADEDAAIELVQAKPAPPEPGGGEREPDEGEPRRRSEAEGGGGRGNRRDCSGQPRDREPVREREPDCRAPSARPRPASLDGLPDADHGVTRSRSCSTRAGPIPGIASRSSTERKGPCAWRQSTIFCAVTGPIPGSSSSWSTVALARLTLVGCAGGRLPSPLPGTRRGPARPPAARRRPARRGSRGQGRPGGSDRLPARRRRRRARPPAGARALHDGRRRRRRRRAWDRGSSLRGGLPFGKRYCLGRCPRRPGRREPPADEREDRHTDDEKDRCLTPRQPLEHDVVYIDNDDVTALTHLRAGCAPRPPQASESPGAGEPTAGSAS